jgi:hypothetical protein
VGEMEIKRQNNKLERKEREREWSVEEKKIEMKK